MAAKGQTIIKKIEVVEGHGHHGGAWKVAYADFMTAMMAFFLLMWILSSSDEQKLRGIAEYFTDATMPGGSGVLDGATLGPPGTLNASNGATVARGSDRGEVDDPSPASWEVMDVTQTARPDDTSRGTTLGDHQNPAGGAVSPEYVENTSEEGLTDGGAKESMPETERPAWDDSEAMADAQMAAAPGIAEEDLDSLDPNSAHVGANAMAVPEQNPDHTADKERFAKLEADIKQAMQESPDLAALQENLVFKETDEGMLVQIMDQEGKPMFASGKARMNKATLKLMEMLGVGLAKLPNDMVISGHTDAVPFADQSTYDNWDLSSDRANAMRRVLLQSGVTRDRITRVSGLADTELLKVDAPKDPSNRRIEVLLAYEKPAMVSPAPAPAAAAPSEQATVQSAEPTATPEPVSNEAMAPKNSVAEEILPKAAPATVLDEQVFENLRSALR